MNQLKVDYPVTIIGKIFEENDLVKINIYSIEWNKDPQGSLNLHSMKCNSINY